MLLHSDVARLVLGYLAEENCAQSYQFFLNESVHLSSVRDAFAEEVSDTAPITVFGKSLCGIIDEYYNMKDAEMQVWNFKNRRHKNKQKFLAMWKKLEEALAAVKSFQVASVLDSLQMKKSFCKNCQAAITPNGVVITPSAPTDLIYGKNSVQKVVQTSLHQQIIPPMDVSNSSMSSVSGGEQNIHCGENRRKKSRRAPKKLSDVERKDKEAEFSADHSSLFLHNITGSETMAVVGSTIMTQMKKCAQSEKESNSIPSNTGFVVDANSAKHNQESIAQLSLQSLLSSAEFNLEGLEFGKEVEELLGIHHEENFNDSSRFNNLSTPASITETTELQQIIDTNTQLVHVEMSAPDMNTSLVTEIPESNPDAPETQTVDLVLTQPSVTDSVLSAPPNDYIEVADISVVEASDVPHVVVSEVEVITSNNPEILDTPVSSTEVVSMETDQQTDISSSIIPEDESVKYQEKTDNGCPTSPKKQVFLLGIPVTVQVSKASEASKSESISKDFHKNQTEPSSNQLSLSNSNSSNNESNSNYKLTSSSNSTEKSNSNNYSNNKSNSTNYSNNTSLFEPADVDDVVNEGSKIDDQVKPGNMKSSETTVVDDTDLVCSPRTFEKRKSVKRLSFADQSSSPRESRQQSDVTLERIEDFEATADGCIRNTDNEICTTPVKSRSKPRNFDESPAKNTRSKSRILATKSRKTPKIVIKSKSANKKSRTRKKKDIKPKDVKRTTKKRSNETELDSSPKEDPECSQVEASPEGSNSPPNVLAAVNLQSACSSPRKLTLRYGLRLAKVDLSDAKEIADAAKEVTKSSQKLNTPETSLAPPLHEIKEDLIDNLLENSQVNVAAVNDPVDLVSGDLAEMNTLSQLSQVPISTSGDLCAASHTTFLPEITPKLSGISRLKSSAKIVVSNDENIEIDDIMEQLAAQVRKSKSEETAQSLPLVVSTVDPNPIALSAPTFSSSANFSELSATPAGREIINATNTGQVTETIESKCQKKVTGDSLIELMNETSLTQLVEDIKNSNDADWNFGLKPSQDVSANFKTISPSAGIFSCLDYSAETTSAQPPAVTVQSAVVPTQIPIVPSNLVTLISTPVVVAAPVATHMNETQIATQNLRAWLNSDKSKTKHQAPKQKLTAMGPLDIFTPGSSYRKGTTAKKSKIYTKKQRLLLPKPVSGTTTTTTINRQPPTQLGLTPISHSARIVNNVLHPIKPKPTAFSLVTPSRRVSNLSNQVKTPVPVPTFALTSSALKTPIKPKFPLPSADSVKPSSVVIDTEVIPPNRIDHVTSHTPLITEGSNQSCDLFSLVNNALNHDVTLTTFTNNSPILSTKPIIPHPEPNPSAQKPEQVSSPRKPEPSPSSRKSEQSSSTRKPEPNPSPQKLEQVPSPQKPEPNPSPQKPEQSSSTRKPKQSPSPRKPEQTFSPLQTKKAAAIPSVIELVSSDPLQCPKPQSGTRMSNRGRLSSIRDSSEEHSLRIITSDEDRLSVLASPTLRKRKLSRKLSPRKKPKLEKFKNSSMSDLVEFLKQVHNNPGDGSRKKEFSEKRKKEKHHKHRLSDPTKIQSHFEKVYFSPSRGSVSQKSFEKRRAVFSEKKSSPYRKASISREDFLRKPKKRTPKPFEKAKRRVSLTSVPIPPSKLGGSPMHLRTPSPVLVCRDSPNTIALVAESLVELSRSRSSYQDASPLASPNTQYKDRSQLSPATTTSVSLLKERGSSKRKKKSKKKLSLDDVNISEFLSTIQYD